MNSKMSSLVICGTDTEVGKTIVSALLVQGLNAHYWKPIQSGLDGGGDRGRIHRLLNLPSERCISEIYAFHAPVSPHWAAEQENCLIEPELLKLPTVPSPIILETAGGLMVPLNRQWLQIDQLQLWKLPVVLVARSGLGTLNHTLLSLEALRIRNIRVLGLVLNGPPHADNPTTLEQLGGVPIIAKLPILRHLTAQALQEQWEKQQLRATFQKLLEPWE